MAKKICRYTLKIKEQKLWESDDMKGWRKAFEACVEDDARDMGSKKYVIYDRWGTVIVNKDVSPLPEPKVAPVRL